MRFNYALQRSKLLFTRVPHAATRALRPSFPLSKLRDVSEFRRGPARSKDPPLEIGREPMEFVEYYRIGSW